MTDEVRRCVECCREWYQAFSNFGKGNERSVKDLLAVARCIESLSAQLDQVTRERDAAVEELSYTRKCSICKNHLSEGGDCYGNHKCGNGNPDWQWRGVEVEG